MIGKGQLDILGLKDMTYCAFYYNFFPRLFTKSLCLFNLQRMFAVDFVSFKLEVWK